MELHIPGLHAKYFGGGTNFSHKARETPDDCTKMLLGILQGLCEKMFGFLAHIWGEEPTKPTKLMCGEFMAPFLNVLAACLESIKRKHTETH